MIDTLRLFTEDFKLGKNCLFEKQINQDLQTGDIVSEKLYCNKVSGINFTVSYDNKLFLQASIPKLLYKTSIHQVKESDAEKAIDIIQDKIAEAGILLPAGAVPEMKLSRLDFCLNLPVKHSVSDYLLTLKNFEFARKNKQSFKNQTITYYNKSSEFAFYDKKLEVLCKEKDAEVLALARECKDNLLRVESRLKNRQAITGEIKAGRLADVFSYSLCKKNLLKNMDKLVKPDIQLDFDFNDSKRVIQQLREERSRDTFNKYLSIYGLRYFLASMDYDFDLIRNFLIDIGYKRRQSYNIIAELKKDYYRYCLGSTERELFSEVRELIERAG